MTDDYKNQLKRLLRNLFQFDSADLDFGIYRIMNKKRDEIERFIEEDLIDTVEAGFGEYSESKGANLKDEIETIKAEIHENLGEDALDDSGELNQIFVTTPFAKKLAGRYEKVRAAMKNSDMSDQHEAEIFSHIHQFFSRYYDNGDFMSLRRYSQKEKYAIPYNGEEVVLHWANKEQYYIKTGEYFRNYSFKIGEYTVEFRILEAEGTTNNNKAEKRFFVLAGDNVDYNDSSKTLTIFFEYRGLSKDEEKEYGTRNVQEVIIAGMKNDIPLQVEDSGLMAALNRVVDKGKDTEKTVLEKHLRAYTKKNTTDYFIHKDLKGFLTQELDFYIKNEVFHLDDLGTENEVGVEQYVSRVRVMKSICLKIIDFLAQIEDFQKMLFEKKKFVVRTDYCMTLDNVPEELYPKIVKNEDQLNEWRVLYGIGEEKQQTITSFKSESIDEAYLKEYPYLVLDTKFFDRKFKDRLLASFDDLDEATGGLMINSENWQALNLMQEKYRENVKCIYIDPPYNTGNDDNFVYKDNYMHSTWISLIENRLLLSKHFLKDSGVILVSINDIELSRLFQLMEYEYGEKNHVTTFIWNTEGNIDNQSKFKQNHEYVLMFAQDERNVTPPEVIDPNVPKDSKLYRDEIVNTIVKNGPKNPISKIELPIGFPVEFNEGVIEPGKAEWPKFDVSIKVEEGKLTEPLIIESGWSSRDLLDKFILNNLRPIEDNIGRMTTFFLKETGAPYVMKKRSESYGHVVTVLKNMGSTQSESNNLSRMGIKFAYPKPVSLLGYLITATSTDDSIILDFFAGSGPTGQAVLKLNKENNNKEDSGKRKYILVEMGDYFDTIMKPRIQKVMYSDSWKDGKPQSTDGISHIFKYQSLEQYEDTLNNIEFTESGTVQRTLMDMGGYFLRYMLDFETREGSPCRFNVEKLTKPFDYTLKITQGNELKEQTVDLVETFNYLLGLHVRQIRTFTNNGTYYRVVLGTKNEDDIVVIWRDTEDLNLKADKEFIEETIIGESNPTKTYINSDFYVEGTHPIEPEFKKLMVG
ncbi:MAG: adenine-specific DNA-methyltransferase [Candidatus Methanocomedens sp.]|nr:MAG: adenine-specific DNA-methyltransferase [ANME-2 cluster archaeon]